MFCVSGRSPVQAVDAHNLFQVYAPKATAGGHEMTHVKSSLPSAIRSPSAIRPSSPIVPAPRTVIRTSIPLRSEDGHVMPRACLSAHRAAPHDHEDMLGASPSCPMSMWIVGPCQRHARCAMRCMDSSMVSIGDHRRGTTRTRYGGHGEMCARRGRLLQKLGGSLCMLCWDRKVLPTHHLP